MAESGPLESVEPAPNPGALRDARIDVLRGAALGLMIADHLPGNSLSLLTPQSFGASDLAEVFLFLSGVVAGGASTRRMLRDGWRQAQRRSLLRALQIYGALLATLVVLLGLERMHAVWRGWPLDMIGRPTDAIRLSGEDWLTRLLTLQHPLGSLSILLLYLVFVPLTPLLIAAAGPRPEAIFLAAVPCYAGAQLWPTQFLPPAGWLQTGALNPFGWQLLYFTGVTLGARQVRSTAPFAPPSHAADGPRELIRGGRVAIVFAALLLLQATFLWKLNHPASFQPAALKTSLPPLRLAHFAALAIVVDALAPAGAPIWRARWLEDVRRCAKRPLLVYCLGVVLSATAHAALLAIGGPRLLDIPATLLCWGLCVVVVRLADAAR